jgi:hypothetical protein
MPRPENREEPKLSVPCRAVRAENLQLPLMPGRIAHLRTSHDVPGRGRCPALTGCPLLDLRAAGRTPRRPPSRLPVTERDGPGMYLR